jgi:hypothetical protein
MALFTRCRNLKAPQNFTVGSSIGHFIRYGAFLYIVGVFQFLVGTIVTESRTGADKVIQRRNASNRPDSEKPDQIVVDSRALR